MKNKILANGGLPRKPLLRPKKIQELDPQSTEVTQEEEELDSLENPRASQDQRQPLRPAIRPGPSVLAPGRTPARARVPLPPRQEAVDRRGSALAAHPGRGAPQRPTAGPIANSANNDAVDSDEDEDPKVISSQQLPPKSQAPAPGRQSTANVPHQGMKPALPARRVPHPVAVEEETRPASRPALPHRGVPLQSTAPSPVSTPLPSRIQLSRGGGAPDDDNSRRQDPTLRTRPASGHLTLLRNRPFTAHGRFPNRLGNGRGLRLQPSRAPPQATTASTEHPRVQPQLALAGSEGEDEKPLPATVVHDHGSSSSRQPAPRGWDPLRRGPQRGTSPYHKEAIPESPKSAGAVDPSREKSAVLTHKTQEAEQSTGAEEANSPKARPGSASHQLPPAQPQPDHEDNRAQAGRPDNGAQRARAGSFLRPGWAGSPQSQPRLLVPSRSGVQAAPGKKEAPSKRPLPSKSQQSVSAEEEEEEEEGEDVEYLKGGKEGPLPPSISKWPSAPGTRASKYAKDKSMPVGAPRTPQPSHSPATSAPSWPRQPTHAPPSFSSTTPMLSLRQRMQRRFRTPLSRQPPRTPHAQGKVVSNPALGPLRPLKMLNDSCHREIAVCTSAVLTPLRR